MMIKMPTLRGMLAPGLLSMVLVCAASSADTVRPVVVELFTSQGCSSCPPADAVLGELAAKPDVLALAYHVDYWDDLGWRDSFSSPDATRRQQQYSRSLRLNGIFTPQVVVDGQTSLVGSNRSSVFKAVRNPRSGVAVNAAVKGEMVVVNVPARDDHSVYDIIAVSYLPETATVVPRGENAGRTLREFNVVRSIRTLGNTSGKEAEFTLPTATLPRDATRIAVLIQEPGTGTIMGAASTSLR